MKPIDKVKIRMYRQGLGDCFLLTFYGEKDSKFNLLIDCGVLSKAKGYEDKMIKVAKDIKTVTEGKIDVLVATHEHWDHLSGFLQAQSIFDSMKIEKIWMAWTEDPNDSFAKKLKTSHTDKLKALTLAYKKLKTQPTDNFNLRQKKGHSKYLNAFDSFFNFFGIDREDSTLNINGTADAFDTLRNRKKSDKVFLEPASNQVIELTELPGIRIYVLGPPKDSKALKTMNPSKTKSEVYELNYNLSLGESFNSALISEKDTNKPFDNKECISLDEAQIQYSSYFDNKNKWRNIDDDWLYSAGNLAIALDNSVNNTSLALAFEFIDSGRVLLFPADAQIGNWLSWSNYQWTVKNNDKKETITIDDLLNRTVFYKVGHHGSHNATMKEQGLEKMNSNELIAMIPVNQQMAKARSWKMPFKPLLEALNERSKDKVIIQDENYPETIKTDNKAEDGITDLYFDVVIHNK
ncbi:MBL fold metallo-hydrolase [Chryseobacterium gambrini]|uniref:MBL fold metallo-hydrolase n=1 Tax=Chryseobacterium gambrini TaxID=373672 RepID=UPI003D0F1671